VGAAVSGQGASDESEGVERVFARVHWVLEDEDCWLDFETEQEAWEFEQTCDDYEKSLMDNHGADLSRSIG